MGQTSRAGSAAPLRLSTGLLCSVHPESGRYGSLCTGRQRPGLAGRTPAGEEACALPQAPAFPADERNRHGSAFCLFLFPWL